MRTNILIPIAVLLAQLAGCSGEGKPWPWDRPQPVPVTSPTHEDRDVTYPAAQPAGAQPAPAATPKPDAAAKTLAPPPSTRPAGKPGPTTKPAAPAPVPAPTPPRPAPTPTKATSAPAPKPAPSPAPIPAPAPVPAPAPALAPTPAAVPVPPPRLAAVPPEKIDHPTDLMELLHPKKPAPATAPAPAATNWPAAPTPAAPKPAPTITVVKMGPDKPVVSRAPIALAPAAAPTPATPAPVPASPAAGQKPSHPDGWASGSPSATSKPAAAPKRVGVGEVVAASAIQVNNHFITVDDICRDLRGRLKEMPAKMTEEAFRQKIAPWVVEEIHAQITRSLVMEEANKRLTDEQKKMVDTEVKEAENDMLVEAGGSKTALKEKLRREGTTLEEALTEHREKAGYKLYLHNRFSPAIVISRQMLWDYYRQNREAFASDKTVQMQIIAAPFGRFMADESANPSALERSAARRKAQQVIAEADAAVKKGEDFGEVAKRLSKDLKAADGGVWPAMALGSFREAPVEQAAFKLLQGQVAGPIETERGFYLVKAYKVQSGRVVSFEEAQEKINETLRDRMYREQTEAYFKTLLEKAHIVQSDRFAQMTLDRAVAKYWNKV